MITDLLRKLNLFAKILGVKVYLVLLLMAFATFFESLGFMAFLPLLSGAELSDAAPSGSSWSAAIEGVTDDFGAGVILTIIVVLFMFKGAFTYWALSTSAGLRAFLLHEVRYRLIQKIFLMSYSEMAKRPTSYYSNLVNDHCVRAVQSFYYLLHTSAQLSSAIVYILAALYVSYEASILSIAIGGVFGLGFRTLNRKLHRISELAASKVARVGHLCVEAVDSLHYLKATGSERLLSQKILAQSREQRNLQGRLWKFTAFTQSLREPLAVLILVVVLYVSSEVLHSALATTIVTVGILYRFINSLVTCQQYWQQCIEFFASMALVDDELKSVRGMPSKPLEAQPLSSKRNEILTALTMDGVRFSHPDSSSPVLDAVSFNLNVPGFVAFVGPSGSGKSTLLGVLLGIYKPSSGSLRFYFESGLSTSALDNETVGYVCQDPIVYDDSLFNNVTLWGDAQCQEIVERFHRACSNAGLEDFLMSAPDGIHTRVGDRGTAMSGGQRQRLCLARELFKSPSVLVLDEATSALDAKTEASIIKTLKILSGNLLVIFVSHNMRIADAADLVLRLQNGKVVTD